MPIVFQSPEPMSAISSYGQGFADTWAKMFPAIASLYGHAYSTQAAAQMQNAAQTQQAQQFQVAQQNQGQLQSQQLQAQADQSQYQATQASALQDQKAQNEAWLNQQALSQSDQMQQTRLQNHLSWLQGGEAADNLTPDQIQGEMNDTIGKLSYLQKRSQNAAMNGLQQQGTMAGHVNAQGLTRQMADMRAQAQQMADMVVEKKLSNGSTVVMTPDGKGGWKETHIKPEDTTSADLKKQALQDKEDAKREKVGTDALNHWTKVNHDAIASIDRKRELRDKNTGQLEYGELKDDDAYVRAIHAERGLRGVPEHTPEEHVAKKLAAYDAETGRTPKQAAPTPSPSATPAQQLGQQLGPQTPPPAARTVQPPFKFAEPKTPQQKQTVEGFQDAFKAIDTTLKGDAKASQDAKVWVSTAQDLLEKYGSEEALPPKERELYDQSLSNYATVMKAARARESAGTNYNKIATTKAGFPVESYAAEGGPVGP